jgi:hypothetical protein
MTLSLYSCRKTLVSFAFVTGLFASSRRHRWAVCPAPDAERSNLNWTGTKELFLASAVMSDVA